MTRGTLVGLALVLATTTLAQDEARAPRWAVGWLGLDGAPTARVRLGTWQIGLAARPDDVLDYVESWEQGYGQALPDSIRDVPQDDKRESGWVRLDVARPVATWDQVTLPLLLAFSYSWSDQQWRERFWNESDQGFSTYDRKTYTNSYSLTLALRPTWRIRRWVALECEFGVRYSWQNYDSETRRTYPSYETPDYDWSRSHGHSFSRYGPGSSSSFGMFNLVFWL